MGGEKWVNQLGPVVRKVDSAIQWIKPWIVFPDAYPLNGDLSSAG